MKAVLCRHYGPPESLQVEDIEWPKAEKNKLVIEVKACGVNFPDTLINASCVVIRTACQG